MFRPTRPFVQQDHLIGARRRSTRVPLRSARARREIWRRERRRERAAALRSTTGDNACDIAVAEPAERTAAVELERARDAYAGRTWLEAHERSRAQTANPLEAEDLELLAMAKLMLGRDDEAIGDPRARPPPVSRARRDAARGPCRDLDRHEPRLPGCGRTGQRLAGARPAAARHGPGDSAEQGT